MVLRILAARGIEITDDARARINICTDLDQLESWGEMALTVAAAADLFA